MSNFKGTKGKWEVQGYNQVVNMYCTIADCENWQLDKTGVEQQHNALIISKAPEMLEMLEELRGIFDKYSVDFQSQFFKYKEPLEQLIKEATEL
jgi:hypothetical protein